jgi:hypothetical protein
MGVLTDEIRIRLQLICFHQAQFAGFYRHARLQAGILELERDDGSRLTPATWTTIGSIHRRRPT